MGKNLQRWLAFGLGIAVLPAASAQATTVSYSDGDSRSGFEGFLSVDGGGSANRITLSYSRGGYVIEDASSLVRGCRRVTRHKVRCEDSARAGSSTHIRGEGGDDRIEIDDSVKRAGEVSVEAGGGADFVRGSKDGDFIEAGTGADVIRARGGNDSIFGGEGPDSLYGGGGNDDVVAKLLLGSKKDRDRVIDCGQGINDEISRDRDDPEPRNCERKGIW